MFVRKNFKKLVQKLLILAQTLLFHIPAQNWFFVLWNLETRSVLLSVCWTWVMNHLWRRTLIFTHQRFRLKFWFKSMFLYFAKLKNITYLIFMINSNDDITCFCICCWTWVRFWLNFWFKSIFLYFAIKQDWNSSSIKKWTENIR